MFGLSFGLTSAMTSGVRRRFQAWSEKRLKPADTLLLTQRNVYILPTRAGLMFVLTLLILLIASINYQLNLGYVLTFLLAGSGLVSMHVTHNTLRGLTLHLQPATPAFAGEPALLDVGLNSDARPRYGVGLKVQSAPTSALAWVDVPSGAHSSLKLSFVAERRGITPLPNLSVETRFPLGLFRSWAIWRPAATLLVYPKPERPSAPLPKQPLVQLGGAPNARQVEGGDTDGVRAYRRGDPLNWLVWKKAARAMETGGELVSRDTRAAARQELWLEWQQCAGLAPEDRLSRLCAWVLATDKAGVDYGLRLPGVDIAPAHGDAHRHRALEALALWN
ncbi:DUF58 domain-containing protein [soil metagenome]